jgi:glutamate decarboxylase
MVHINRVATHKEISEEQSQFEAIDATTSISLTPDDKADDFTATVYGSKYAAEDLPRYEMPVSPPMYAYLYRKLSRTRIRKCRHMCKYNAAWSFIL